MLMNGFRGGEYSSGCRRVLALVALRCVRVCLASLLGLYANPASGAQDSEWILQQHKDVQGDLVVYVSHDAVKIINAHRGYQVVTKAPAWTVHCFRPLEKTEWKGGLEAFTGAMLENPGEDGNLDQPRLAPVGKGELIGLKCTKYASSRQTG